VRWFVSEDGPLKYVSATIPGESAWAALHDMWGALLVNNGAWNPVINGASMLFAFAITHAGLLEASSSPCAFL